MRETETETPLTPNSEFVVVEWEDAAQYPSGEWHDDTGLSPIRMTTVGFLVKEDDTLIAVAQDYSPDRDDTTPYRNLSVIPKVNICKVHRFGQALWQGAPLVNPD